MTKIEERIIDLSQSVAVLVERMNNERFELRRVDAERARSAEQLAELSQHLAVIDDNLKELKKDADVNSRRRWAVVVASICCLLTLAANDVLLVLRSGR